MVLERWTNPTISRRTCTCEHGLQSWGRLPAGVAKRRVTDLHPNPNVTIRNFCTAVRQPVSLLEMERSVIKAPVLVRRCKPSSSASHFSYRTQRPRPHSLTCTSLSHTHKARQGGYWRAGTHVVGGEQRKRASRFIFGGGGGGRIACGGGALALHALPLLRLPPLRLQTYPVGC
jgi:hypothetical protein